MGRFRAQGPHGPAYQLFTELLQSIAQALEEAGILLKQPNLDLGYVRAWLGHLQEGAEVDLLGRLDEVAASVGR